MKRFTFLCLLIIYIYPLNAQKENSLGFFAGYGFYEGANLGTEYFFSRGIRSVNLSLGYMHGITREKQSFTLSSGFNNAILHKYKNKQGLYRWHLCGRVVYWHLEDDTYIWNNLSLILALKIKYVLFENLTMSFDAGPSFNIPLSRQRKSFEDIGWIKEIMPNVRVLFII